MTHNNKTPERPTNSPEHPVVRENRLMAIRLHLAQAFVGMWRVAYDALLTHGVNFRTIPEYAAQEQLDVAVAKEIDEGYVAILGYIERVESGIKAAVRRKSFTRIK